jgi:hypothetical protein
MANRIEIQGVAGRFIEVFQYELDSMKPEEPVYCALHEQGEYPTIRHHYKILGFPFSEYSCSKEAQMVVNLLTALLSKADEGHTGPLKEQVFEKVCTPYFSVLPS